MKHVEIGELITAVPVVEPMTRKQKLQRLAKLVREYPRPVHLLHGLEYVSPRVLDQNSLRDIMDRNGITTALNVAAADPKFQAQGLTQEVSICRALSFFELTQNQAHVFSCDCGGAMSNADQAELIEALAG